MTKVLDKLKRLSFFQLLWIFVTVSEILTLIIVVLMSIVFRGQITYDYLITGAVAAFFVSFIVVSLSLSFTKELQKTQEVLRSLEKAAETTQVGITITDLEGKILYTNPAEAKMHGYTVEKLIGKNARIFAPQNLWDPMTLERIKEMKTFKRQSVNIREDGSTFPVQLLSDVIRDADGRPIGIVTTCEDISERKLAEEMLQKACDELEMRVKERTYELTKINEQLQQDISERKRAEDALRGSEDKYRQHFENVSDVIYSLDPGGIVLSVSPSVERVLGYKPEELLGRAFPALNLLTPESLERAFSDIRHVLAGEKIISTEYEFIAKDGTRKFGEVSGDPLFRNAKVVAIISVARDITERKKTEGKIKLYQEMFRSLIVKLSLLEEQERRRISEELHDNISQNLVLAKIKIASLKESVSSAGVAGDLGKIQELIEEAIQFTRSLTFELSPPVLYKLGIEASIEWLTDEMQEKYGIIIDFVSDGKLKKVNGEISILLYKTVRELLINIVKHAQASKAKVAIGRDGNNIRIAVDDNGIGFDVEKLYGDSGKIKTFGLFSINERINHIGGTIEIKSRPKQGTLIDLIVPIESNTNKWGYYESKNYPCR